MGQVDDKATGHPGAALTRRWLLGVGAAGLVGLTQGLAGRTVSAAPANAAVPTLKDDPIPSGNALPRWRGHDPGSTLRVDHSGFDRFLKQHLRLATGQGPNRVAYGQVSAAERAALGAYVDSLAAIEPTVLARREQFPFWVNLYNAVTVKVILDHYPVTSIRDIDISPGLFAQGPWGKPLIRIGAEQISLDDVEHRILRPIWQSPLVHYAVNCASVGCPNLLPEAFTAANTAALLEGAARAFVNDPRGVRVEGDALTVSRIYDWFSEDFGRTEADIIAHLASLAAPALAARLQGRTAIDRYDYDWSLNDDPPVRGG